MPRAGHNDRSSSSPESVPQFWLRTEEHGVEIIDKRVVAVAEESWPWAFSLVKKDLNDGACTAEVVEQVAIDVTNRLRVNSEVGRNLAGYFRTAVIRRIRTLAARNSRVIYEGGPHDLETNYRPMAPHWTKICDDRMTIERLFPHMSHPVRHILHYRLLEYSWKHTAKELGITEQQAKKRFYYGMRQAYDEFLADRAKRSQEKERGPRQ